ncbi:MAG: T9SS type A sorting domain-containing protein, partial [Bacteroidales bacterium]|nr:T9SS type A sorting domain-containing protein [Bacteroidales bacterium]
SLYKKVEPAYTLTINAHTTNGGWYLIASPVAVNPANVEGMTIENSEDPNYSNFDLYYFDQTGGQNGKEWKNYKANHFDLELGKGYLYANANTVDLTFTGVMNGDFEDVDLPYDADDDIKSLYLAGNSKTMAETFYVYDGNLVKQTVNFLTINETGDGFITTSSNEFEADALQGFFVQSAGEGWTLSTADMDAKSGTPELLNVMVSQNRGALIDNAIVSFGNAPLMSKFYLSDNSTRVFIQQNGEEMAVVRTEAQGEMPVNFKAAENGTYTLTVNPEGVEMNYLHLIDNMTGADIDLLAATSTGSVATYTFNASTTDYSSRFRLVFAANNEDGVSTGSTAFAFYSNGTWVINNTGEATLQVVDVNGRILSSETANGSVSKAINAPAGVYMLRLINGNDVKTQKIVVR